MANVKGRSENLVEIDSAKDLAIEHLFERSSVARELHAAGMLLRRGIGRVSVEAARIFAQTDSRFIRPDPTGSLLTTREVLAEERRTVETCRDGQGAHEAIGRGQAWEIRSEVVAKSEEQSRAVHAVLESKDLVTTLHGPAGSGKTTLSREIVAAVETLSGSSVIMLAPSSSAVGVLKSEGFSKAETFQRFQTDELLQSVASGEVLWVDEAGFLSSRQMHWLVQFAERERCRLILSGDTLQHHGVERGDALRVLENAGVVTQARLTTIVRQQVEPLRLAVQELSQGRTESGFDQLDQFGAVQEIEDKTERLNAIADLHLAARAAGESSLIVAPTHAECRAIADAVRAKQREQGLLGVDHMITRLAKTNLTVSQRRDPISYQAGDIIEFHRRAAGGFKSGEQWEVQSCSDGGVQILKDGQTKLLPLTHASTFDVYTRELMPLAAGDVVRFTKNFVAKGGKCRNNDLATVQTVTSDHVTTTDGRVMPTLSLLHVDQGIAVTSHASQGKTVDNVIVSAPVAAFAQVNEAQLYVSMSRARRSMHLVTDCKEALREAVCRPSERISALELSAEHAFQRDIISLDQQLQAARLKKEIQKTGMKHYKVLQRDFGHEQHHPPPPPQPEHDRTQGPGMSRGF